MTEKVPLTSKVAESIAAAMSGLDPDDPTRFTAAAHAARVTMARQLTDYADAMGRACVRLNHRGSSAPDTPCRACSPRVAHVKSIIQIVQPDD